MVQSTPLTLAAAVIFLNERDLLPRMLASIERQVRRPELLLLVDDGSSDGSHELATSFAAEHPYARVVRGLERERTSDRLARAHCSRLERQPYDEETAADGIVRECQRPSMTLCDPASDR